MSPITRSKSKKEKDATDGARVENATDKDKAL